MGLYAQATYFLFKCRVLLVALGDDQRIDSFADNRFPMIEHLITDTVTIAELKNRPEMRYMPKKTVQECLRVAEQQRNTEALTAEIAARAIEVRRKLILALHETGAGLLLGSDAPQILNVPGFSIHRELELIVAAGLTPFEALQTGTTAVAEYLGTNTDTIAVGREADLILLDANPLPKTLYPWRLLGVTAKTTSRLNRLGFS